MTATSVLQPLFGGAMQISLPPGFEDVSTVRQIPDNQEVFTKGDESIIIELLEQQQSDLREAIQDHFTELSQLNESRESEIRDVQVMDNKATLHGTQKISKFNTQEYKQVHLSIGLRRLTEFQTDVLVTLHSDYYNNTNEMLESLSVLNPGLFELS